MSENNGRIFTGAGNPSGQNDTDVVKDDARIGTFRQFILIRALLAWAFYQITNFKIKFIPFNNHYPILVFFVSAYHNHFFNIKRNLPGEFNRITTLRG
ncbi:MAG: hypothetical protein WA081_21665 [Desulfosalsimonadaceae bacterium]